MAKTQTYHKKKDPLPGKKLRLMLCVLLLLLAALAAAGRQAGKTAQENRDCDAQIQMKPTQEDGTLPMDFTGLQSQNPDIVGWITVAGLGVDYPVVQGADNSFYLEHTAEKKYNRLGSLFLDFRANRDFSDFNSVVYGHRMKSGRMFGQLERLRERAVFDRITEGALHLPGKTCRLEIFAVVAADSHSEFYQYIFPTPQSRRAHLEMIQAHAIFYRDIGVTADDKLVALSTCSYEYEGARTLVIARIA